MIIDYNGNENKPVIYLIHNTHTNRFYIGEGKEAKRRISTGYKRKLVTGKCHNKYLQNDYDKCKEKLKHDDFIVISILEVLPDNFTKAQRVYREKCWIWTYFENGKTIYNFKLKEEGNDKSCFSHTPEESKIRISQGVKKFWEGLNEDGKEQILSGLKNFYLNETKEEKEIRLKKLSGIRKEKMEDFEYAQKVYDILKLGVEANIKTYSNLKIQSPSGEIITEIANLSEFCKINKLNIRNMRTVIENKRRMCQGWINLLYVPKPIKKRVRIQPYKTYTLLNPQNEIVVLTNLTKFCKENNLETTGLIQVANGKAQIYKGWRLPININYKSRSTHTGFQLQAPDGTIYTEIKNMKKFAEQHDLDRTTLTKVINGKTKSHKGWTLVK